MEPKLKRNNYEENTEYIDEMGFHNNSSSKQAHFLSLRKNRRLNLQVRRFQNEKTTGKYELNQNSYDQSNEIIQKFFNSQDKQAFLYELISNFINSIRNSKVDLNIVKFIIVQCLNYYESQKENQDKLIALEKFFTNTIITNLIDAMFLLKTEYIIVYNISLLLLKLTYCSAQITKLITLNSNNIEKIFNCLTELDKEVNNNILNVIYNCYYEDEDNVNTKCNIGLYVFGQLNNYSLNLTKERMKSLQNDENLKILVSFLDILINKKTSKVYKTFDIEARNNIIYLLLVLCQDILEENFKLDSHNGLERMLSLAEPEDLDIDRFGICNINSLFLPHIKLESNSPEIVEKSMEIIEKLSYLCDVEIILKDDFFEQFENILVNFNDMNTNINNPKPFYSKFKKKNINNIINSLAIILSNAITLEDHENYIVNHTNIIKYLVLCLKIIELENESLKNIYDFFKDFIINKDNCVKVILENFIDIGIIYVLNNNLSKKNFEIIQSVLDVCLIMMKECSSLTPEKGNIMKMYLEKKGFNEVLTLIIGADFGNMNCSETAKSIQDNFFNK